MIDHVNDLFCIMSWSCSWSVSLGIPSPYIKALDVAVSASLASLGVSLDNQSCIQPSGRSDFPWSFVLAEFHGRNIGRAIKMFVDDQLVPFIAFR